MWDVIGTDAQGNEKVIKATPLYADEKAVIKSETSEDSGEGGCPARLSSEDAGIVKNETAKANGVNTYHYLAFLLEKFPSSLMSDDELEPLAPWNEAVKAEISISD